MKKGIKGLIGLSIILVSACQGNSGNEAIYKEAYDIQKEVIAELSMIEGILDTNTTGTYESLEETLHEIEESLVEIPGYHLELPGHEGHDHSHGETQLSAEDILAVQKELLKQLKDIKVGLGSN